MTISAQGIECYDHGTSFNVVFDLGNGRFITDVYSDVFIAGSLYITVKEAASLQQNLYFHIINYEGFSIRPENRHAILMTKDLIKSFETILGKLHLINQFVLGMRLVRSSVL